MRVNGVSVSSNSTTIKMLYILFTPYGRSDFGNNIVVVRALFKETIRGPVCSLTVVCPSEFSLLSYFFWVLPQDKTMAYLGLTSEQNPDRGGLRNSDH